MQAIHTTELKKMLNDRPQPTLINTLSESDFSATRIPNSINIPQTRPDFIERVEEAVGDHDRPVVVYCAGPECDSSTKAAQKLAEAGFAHVYDFEGGAQEWQEAGGRLQAAT